MTLYIETDRLILRPLQLTDEDDLLEYQSHPEIVQYIPWPERTRDEVRIALQKAIDTSKFELIEEQDSILLGWELKSGIHKGKVIGQSNLGLVSLRDQTANIGWVTHQDFQRQGFAFEASYALMEYGFMKFNIHRIVADIDTRAEKSAALAERLGMRREGTFIESEFFKGKWTSVWLYGILKREFTG